MISKMLIGCGTMAIFFCFAATGVAQILEVDESGSGLQRRRPSTSIADIRKALAIVVETKEYQEKIELDDFVKKFEKAISKKGKDVQITIEHDAFKDDKGQRLFILRGEVVLPPVPTKMVANTALRLVLSQVEGGKSTFWLRSGQIVITSEERAESSYFAKNAEVEMKCKNRPLVDVLDALAEQSGVSIIVDGRVAKKAQAKVTAKFFGKLETAVRLLTDSVGLKHVIVDNVIYVTSPANADGFQGKTAELGVVGLLAYKDRPLLNAIDAAYGNWVLDSRVKHKANIRVTAKWLNQVDADTAIRLLTDMAGLRHVVVDGVVYITDAANAKTLMEEESRKKPEKRDPSRRIQF